MNMENTKEVMTQEQKKKNEVSVKETQREMSDKKHNHLSLLEPQYLHFNHYAPFMCLTVRGMDRNGAILIFLWQF